MRDNDASIYPILAGQLRWTKLALCGDPEAPGDIIGYRIADEQPITTCRAG